MRRLLWLEEESAAGGKWLRTDRKPSQGWSGLGVRDSVALATTGFFQTTRPEGRTQAHSGRLWPVYSELEAELGLEPRPPVSCWALHHPHCPDTCR